MTTVAIINARLLDPASDYDGPGGLLIKDGRISRVIHGPTPDLAADQIIDADGHCLAPGLSTFGSRPANRAPSPRRR